MDDRISRLQQVRELCSPIRGSESMGKADIKPNANGKNHVGQEMARIPPF